ncbi:MAG: AAA family ATPase, partial [Alphaproteobacteria bacterium]|nr:AAA family ATPase [Alphaproteobacteria bacterium]
MTGAYEIATWHAKGTWNESQQDGKTCCPAHDDNKPSLSVKQEGDKVLVHCHAGCSQEDVISAFRMKGVWPERPTSFPAQAKPKPKPIPAVVADDEIDQERFLTAYKIYYAARGPKYFQDGRTTENPKTNVKEYLTNRGITANVLDDIYELPAGKLKQFGLRRAGSAMVAPMVASSALCGSSDDWFTGVHVTRLARDGRSKADSDPRRMRGLSKGSVVPFGPPEGDILFVAEGLETAMSVYQATGKSTWSALSAGNMNAIAIPSWTKEVIVCADNDNAGLKAAKPLAERVAAMGKTARLAIPENDGDDWNVTLQSHGDEFCRDAILKAEIIEALTPQSFRVITAGEFVDLTFPPRENLLPPWLPRQGLALIHGWRGVGKTWVVLGIACAVASGKEFLGWTAGRPAEVLYVDGELPASGLQDRLRQFQATFGDEIGDRIWIDTPDRRDGIVPDLSTLEGQA